VDVSLRYRGRGGGEFHIGIDGFSFLGIMLGVATLSSLRHRHERLQARNMLDKIRGLNAQPD